MQMTTNFTNITKRNAQPMPGQIQIDSRILERLRFQNANLQKQIAAAKAQDPVKLAQKVDDGRVASLKAQLTQAHRVIADLEAKVKNLTTSLNEKSFKKDKKADTTASLSDKTSIKITAN